MPAASRTAPAGGAFDRAALLAGLQAGLDELGLDLEPTAPDRLIDYLGLLAKWNAVYNLTAIRDPRDMLVQHLLDSLSIVGPLTQLGRVAGPLARLDPYRSVVDVGSGGGLPGIVLAIVWPHAEIHLVEPVGKKAAFLRQCAGELSLANAQVHAERVEALARGSAIVPDLVVCRAFASLRDYVLGLGDLAGPTTIVSAMKGQLPVDEIDELPPGWHLGRAIPLRVPQLGAQRHLLLLERRPGDGPAPARRSAPE